MKKLLTIFVLMLVTFMGNAQSCPDNNHPHMIDLGLPSGTKWACCNVDDDHSKQSPTNEGSFYSWGEVKSKDYYWEGTYQYFQNGNYVNIGSDIAGTQYDVAHYQWGGSWVMPSKEQIEELICGSYCWIEWKGGGALFTSKTNDSSIFLPAAGIMLPRLVGPDHTSEGLHSHGHEVCYWSSSQSTSKAYNAYMLYIHYDLYSWQWNRYDHEHGREYGLSVRPVTPSSSIAPVHIPIREGLSVRPVTPSSSTAFNVAEKMPEYPGGIEAFMKFVSENIHYPEAASKAGIQGEVLVNFIVEKDGTISNIHVFQKVNDYLDAEAVRVVGAMPKWTPGMQDGKAVRVNFTVPIDFRLD